jgi:mannose-6-phosphate isomerase
MKIDYILKFRKNLHPAIWGGESWEMSVHPSGPSVIANGPLAGRSLAEVLPGFPLLVKTIDARTRLSVQVHPSESTAPITGGEPKTEMWCLLTDGPIYAGLKRGATAQDVTEAVSSGSFEDLLVRHDGHAGDAFFIPGGLVHAIGDGVKLYEVQQSSNTTFRLYDWGRTGTDGRPRELHIESSLKAMDLTIPPPTAVKEVTCEFFDFRQFTVEGRSELASSRCGTILFVASGTVSADDTVLTEGESAFVPPGMTCTLTGSTAKVFVSHAHG